MWTINQIRNNKEYLVSINIIWTITVHVISIKDATAVEFKSNDLLITIKNNDYLKKKWEREREKKR